MNKHIIDAVEVELKTEQSMGDVLRNAVQKKKDIEPHRIGQDVSFSDITQRLSKDDIEDQTRLYRQLLEIEATSMADQLDHRAHLMRQRADEFNEIASGLRSQMEALVKRSDSFLTSRSHVLELIQRHAFIQPTKVDNNG